MNTPIVMQTTSDVNAEPLENWEQTTERAHKWHGKSLKNLSRRDNKVQQLREQSSDWGLWL